MAASCAQEEVVVKLKRRRRTRVEHLIRTVEVRSFNVYGNAGIDDAKGSNPKRSGGAWLEFRGVLDEPVKGQLNTRIGVHEAKDDNLGSKRPAVGYVFGTKPELHVVVTLQPDLFERILMMAIAGRVMHAWISMTPPHYGQADVPSISFSNEPIE
jgi:hypothetical protein